MLYLIVYLLIGFVIALIRISKGVSGTAGVVPTMITITLLWPLLLLGVLG